MTLEDYRKSVLKVREKRNTKLKSCVYTKTIYTESSKDSPIRLVNYDTFSLIIKTINNYIIDQLLKGDTITLPYSMGKLYLTRRVPTVKYKEGELINTYPIDWDATIKLWYKDEKAKEKKQRVYLITDKIFKINYDRVNAKYINKSLYRLRSARTLKNRLRDSINNNNIEAFDKPRYE